MKFNFILFFAIITILISLTTWGMDLFSLVNVCINCRIERTIIGILGVILLFPSIPQLLKFVVYGLGFFGAFVASDQMFSILMNYQITIELMMATCALMIILIQVFYIHFRKS